MKVKSHNHGDHCEDSDGSDYYDQDMEEIYESTLTSMLEI